MNEWPDPNDPTKEFKPRYNTERETDGSIDMVNRVIYEMEGQGWHYWAGYWPVDRKHLMLTFWRNDEPPATVS